MTFGRMKTLAMGALFAFALVACSNGADGGGTPAGGGGSNDQGGGSPSVQATVAIASGDLGQMLVDAQGRTLYMFLADTGDKSTCYGDCATTWPALTADGQPSAGEGVDASLLGTTARTDGTTQVTFDGHPVYHFSGDTAAGDTNGEGIGNVWFVVSSDGTPLKAGAGGGGYGKY